MGNKKTILIVEEDEKERGLLISALRKYECVPVSDFNRAFEIADSASPDLVIVDLGLPFRNGFTFLEKKSSDPVLSRVPAIVAVDEKDEIRQLRGMALGAVAYLKKPYSGRVVTAQIEKFFGEPSFNRFRFPKGEPGKAKVTCTGWLKLLGETAFVMEAPIKLALNTSVEVDCPVFNELGLSESVMKTSQRPPFQVETGLFSDEVTLVGVGEVQAQRIRKTIQPWGDPKWSL